MAFRAEANRCVAERLVRDLQARIVGVHEAQCAGNLTDDQRHWSMCETTGQRGPKGSSLGAGREAMRQAVQRPWVASAR